jgi:hypothetical protein
MTRETLIKVIEEEFDDEPRFSNIIDTFIKAVMLGDSKITECTKMYEDQLSTVISYLDELRDNLLDMEKEERETVNAIRSRKVK